jgi:integrase
MASAYDKRGVWYLRYKNEHGRWVGRPSAAKTKTEARRMAEDLERKAERIRLGLELPVVIAGDRTVADILTFWLEEVWKGRPSYDKAKSAIDLHLLTAPFAGKRPPEVTSGEIERHLESKLAMRGKKRKPLGPQAVNHLREFLRKAFKTAIKEKMLAGPNPVDEVKRWVVPTRKHDFLRFHEVPSVLAAVRPHWRPLFATAIYAGLRKGELFGLRRSDVDLATGMITVQRSYDRATTKGRRSDAIPIAAELRPYIERALATTPGELVFSRADGSMYPETTQLEAILRRALRRAGIVIGYRHKCRKQGCGEIEASTDPAVRRCPKDGRKMWVTSVVRPIRFHDLRHTTGSLLTMRGANTAFVQRIMRHSDPRITTQTYCHLEPDYLQAGMDSLMRLGASEETPVPPTAQPEPVRAAAAQAAGAEKPAPFATRLLPDPAGGAPGGLTDAADPQAFPPLAMERDIGFEPTTFSLGS